jgi:hypothetical protein
MNDSGFPGAGVGEEALPERRGSWVTEPPWHHSSTILRAATGSTGYGLNPVARNLLGDHKEDRVDRVSRVYKKEKKERRSVGSVQPLPKEIWFSNPRNPVYPVFHQASQPLPSDRVSSNPVPTRSISRALVEETGGNSPSGRR